MAEERKWEDLQTDCLINIFARLDTETLAEFVQFVCKSWYKSTLTPQCWQNLVFTQKSCSDAFVKFAVARSQNSTTSVILRPFSLVSDESWLCIAQGCPLLKILDIPAIANEAIISELIHYWKNLECIKLETFDGLPKILESISLHCKNFNALLIPDNFIFEEQAECIVRYVPKIKVLDMSFCFVEPSCIVMILKGCRELVSFDLSYCAGFDENDGELMKLASHIRCFNTRGSKIEPDPDCRNFNCPLLKILHLCPRPSIPWTSSPYSDSIIIVLIEYWKNLECIKLHTLYYMDEILESISLHCKNFSKLLVSGGNVIKDGEAAMIVRYVPKIKVLDMYYCSIKPSSMLMILKGCHELEFFYASACVDFDDMDDEMIKLASNIKSFNVRQILVLSSYRRPLMKIIARKFRHDLFSIKMAEERKWEDIETDCLINILSRVDTETLVESVQFVCKSWYQATLSPQCWQNLHFTERLFSDDYVQYVVDRSQLSATSVIFDYYARISDQSWFSIAQCFPLLKILHLPRISGTSRFIRVHEMIHNWNNLECIKLRTLYDFAEILESISLHCENFNELMIPNNFIEDEQAVLIVRYIPKIRF